METLNNPLVTIATSMYNVEEYVVQNIESLLAQTYKNLEIILVDDGSPDKSGEIADFYASKDSRIKVVHQNNTGLGGGRNAAIDIATGDYITFVDADDYLCPDFVEYMLSLIITQNADMSISKNCFTTSDMEQVKTLITETYTPEKAMEEFFFPNIRLGAWNKIYSMEFLHKYSIRFVPELKTGEGLEFITRAASRPTKLPSKQESVCVSIKQCQFRHDKGQRGTARYRLIGNHGIHRPQLKHALS